jgi:hypothetical protein
LLPVNHAPVFIDEVANFTIIAGEKFLYKIPKIVDPDGDKYFITANLGEASTFG